MRAKLQMIRKTEQAAGEELAQDAPDPNRVGQLLVEAKAMRAEVKDIDDDFIAQAQALMTRAQMARLASLGRMVPYQNDIRQGQSLGLLPNTEGEFSFGGAQRGGNRARRNRPGQRGQRGGRQP